MGWKVEDLFEGKRGFDGAMTGFQPSGPEAEDLFEGKLGCGRRYDWVSAISGGAGKAYRKGGRTAGRWANRRAETAMERAHALGGPWQAQEGRGA